MPIRFRRIISFGKKFRLNLSKGGISSSFGGRGASVNFGRRGIRPTVGIPGTGLSFTPSSTNTAIHKSKNPAFSIFVFIVSGLLICVIAICCLGVIFLPLPEIKPTPTAEAQIPIEQIIAMTALAAEKQTQAAYSPTPYPSLMPTATLAPAIIPVEATATIFIFELQTQVAQPTLYVYQTNTPLALATQPQGGGEAACSCSGDTLNCSDFQTHASAQACFDYCVSQGRGDIHKLDKDNNGIACESLP